MVGVAIGDLRRLVIKIGSALLIGGALLGLAQPGFFPRLLGVAGRVPVGLLVLLGLDKGDDRPTADRMLERILAYRVFADENGRMLKGAQMELGRVKKQRDTVQVEAELASAEIARLTAKITELRGYKPHHAVVEF